MIPKYIQNRDMSAWILFSSFRPDSSAMTGKRKPIIGVSIINGIPMSDRYVE